MNTKGKLTNAIDEALVSRLETKRFGKLTMQYQVFVQSQSERHFVASVVGMPNLIVEGRTEEEAIANAKTALAEQLATGKFVTIEVNPNDQSNIPVSQMRYAGIFADDPTFDDFMEKLAVIRKESNAAADE